MKTSISSGRGFGRVIFYGWWIVALAALANALMNSPVWGGIGVWVSALEQEFGWSRTQLALAFSLGQLEGSVTGPVVGFLVDRIGPRKIIFSGALILGAGFVSLSFVDSLLMFYVSFGVIMLGATMGGWMPMMAVLNAWFDRRRTFAMGIASSGFSMGGLVLIPILAWAVTPEHVGWQVTSLWIGIMFIVIAWPFSRLIRNRPEDYGQLPDGRSADEGRSIEEGAEDTGTGGGFTARQALRTKAFWLVAIGHGATTMGLSTLVVHLIPSLIDQGMTLQASSFIWATMLGTAGVAQIIGGYVGDRIQKNVAMALFSWLQAIGLCLAALSGNLLIAFIFALTFGVGFGGRVPMTTAIRGEYFGRRAFGSIMGLSSILMAGFTLVGPLFAGVVYDARESYFLAFIVMSGVTFLGGLVLLNAKKPTLPAPREIVKTPTIAMD